MYINHLCFTCNNFNFLSFDVCSFTSVRQYFSLKCNGTLACRRSGKSLAYRRAPLQYTLSGSPDHSIIQWDSKLQPRDNPFCPFHIQFLLAYGFFSFLYTLKMVVQQKSFFTVTYIVIFVSYDWNYLMKARFNWNIFIFTTLCVEQIVGKKELLFEWFSNDRSTRVT